jgi:AbrB family looped-hinge helix DNA binding protein
MNFEVARLTSKGQITIPVAIRERLKLKTGDKVFFIEDDKGVRIINSSALDIEGAINPSRRE